MSCSDHRPRLGELLTGALDDDELAALGAHLEDCLPCQDELAALGALEETLLTSGSPSAGVRPHAGARPGSPSGLSRVWIAAALAAALALGALLGLAGHTPAPGRLVRGSLEGYGAGQRVPAARELLATQPGLLALGQRAGVELTPGTRFRLESQEAVHLSRGDATFRVTPGQGGFAVVTPRGRVSVLGTVFRVAILEGSMGSNGKAGLAAVVAVVVTAGVVMFESGDGHDPVRVEAGQAILASTEGVRPVDLEAAVALERELSSLREEHTRLQAERDALRADRQRLEGRVAELEQAQAAVEAPAETGERVAPVEESRSSLAVAFGAHRDLEALQDADWATMAAASRTMVELMPELLQALEAGGDLPPELRVKLGAENQKLLGLALAINGKLPTHASGNGEYTHPVVMANLIAAAVEQAGRPLGETQSLDLARLGEDFEREWDRLQAGYGDETLAVTKVLDELRLKQHFTEQARALLDPAQGAALGPESSRDRAHLDLFSPGLLLVATAAPVVADTPEDLRGRLLTTAASTWGLEVAELSGFEGLFEGFATSLPNAKHRNVVQFLTVPEALAAGQAQQKLMHELLRLLPLDEARQARMREAKTLLMPRLIAPE
jgi:hypothetical protein